MFYQEILKKPIQYYDTLLISAILSIVTIPSLWYISDGNILWVISCAILWWLGLFMLFQPALRYLFPHMLTQIGTIALIFIISTLSIFLNSMLIMIFIPNSDIEMIMDMAIFSSSINNIFLFMWFYIIVAVTIMLNLDFQLDKISNILSMDSLEYFIEMLLIFILPIIFLFWTDITYSSRVLLGVISVSVGLAIFIQKLEIESRTQKLLASIVYGVVIFIINSTIINSFGVDRIPNRSVKANIFEDKIFLNMEAKTISNPLFQLSNNSKDSRTNIYKIVASIPIIGLNLGYRVATIPNRELSIKATDTQYSVYDEFNHKKLITLDK